MMIKFDPAELRQLAKYIVEFLTNELKGELAIRSTRSPDPGGSFPKAMMRLKEAAWYLDVCERQLWGLYKAGKIPSVDVGMGIKKKAHRFPVKDLDAWIETNKRFKQEDGGI